MLKHTLNDSVLHVSIDSVDFSYRIPLAKLGKTVSWCIGTNKTDGIVVKNVSAWTLQLFTRKVTDEKYIQQFKGLIQTNCPVNSIDWKATQLALSIQNEYNRLMSSVKESEKSAQEKEIIARLEEKYQLA